MTMCNDCITKSPRGGRPVAHMAEDPAAPKRFAVLDASAAQVGEFSSAVAAATFMRGYSGAVLIDRRKVRG